MITKYDLVDNGESETSRLSLEDYKRTEDAVIRGANLLGAKKHNSIRWTSYTDDTGDDNPNIDNIALNFIESILRHSTGKPVRELPPVPTPSLQSENPNNFWMFLLCVLVAVVVAFVYKALTSKI